MDNKAFAKVLVEYAKRRPNHSSDSELWNRIAAAFGGTKKCQVSEILARFGATSSCGSGTELLSICSEAKLLAAFAYSLKKAPIADALEQFVTTIQSKRELTIDDLEALTAQPSAPAKGKSAPKSSKSTEPVDPNVIAGYLKRLEESLGDEQGFAQVLGDLKQDSRLKFADYKSLSKSFTGAFAGSKLKALEAIERRNRLLIDARVKSEMNAGKTAA